MAGIASGLGSDDVATLTGAAQIETENNALVLIPIALELIDKGITVYDAWQLEIALREGRTEDAEEIAAGIALGMATEAVPGNKILQKIGEVIGKTGKQGDEVMEGAGDLVNKNQELAAELAKRPDIKQVHQVNAGNKGSWDKAINGTLEPNTAYVLNNGHAYITDAAGRVKSVEAQLDLGKMDRNGYQQRCTGKCGEAGDEGGHLIASALGGAGDKINLVPQDKLLNRGDWRAMEREFQNALTEGKSVSVKVDVGYPAGGGERPSTFLVTAVIDGKVEKFPFRQ